MKRASRRLFVAATLLLSLLPVGVQRTNAVIGGVSALGNTVVVRLVNGNSVCSGALWTSRIVVTAGHCVVNSAGDVTSNAILVYQPGVDVRQNTQTVTQSAIITVQGWRKLGEFSQPDDIAFLVLNTELPGAVISRLATPTEVVGWAREGRLVTFLGYGRTSPTSTTSPIPNAIDQPLNTLPTWPGAFSAAQTSTTGICSGDSGGPVVTRVGDELVLLGVNSAASGPCSASSRPSMTGFMPSAYPDLVRQALALTSVAALPTVATRDATGISTTSAVLAAEVTANNLLTSVSFTYGLQPDLGGATFVAEAGSVSGATPTRLEVAVAGLMPGMTYYFRASATNLTGTVNGAVLQFFTSGGTPVVVSDAAQSVSSDSAVVSGSVNANTVATQVFFQYSQTPDFVTLDGTVTAGDVNGTETTTMSATLPRLRPGTTYYWRIAATNAAGTTVGETKSFATPVFVRSTSLTTNALLNRLSIDRTNVSRVVVSPTTNSRRHCSFNTRTRRLVFGQPGRCRINLSITRDGTTTKRNFNLVVVARTGTP